MKVVNIILIIFCISFNTNAESTKFVQWWGEYMPHYDRILPGGYQNKRSIQYQDVNGDGVYNDVLIWYEFDLNKQFNPPSERDTGKDRHRYRTDFPSAIFYGGIITRFTNVANVTVKDTKGNDKPFDALPQVTVQPRDGSRPCSYMVGYPNNSYYGRGDHEQRADMTVFIVEPEKWKQPISKVFHATKNAEVNFSTLFLWKKENFINGGANVKQVTFDATSKLSVNLTRQRANIEEGRFVVQDGEQFWISEAAIVQNEAKKFAVGINGMAVEALKYGAVVQLNPLNSRWAKYNPRQDTEKVSTLTTTLEGMEYKPTASNKELYQTKSDELLAEVNKMEFKPQNATFVEHDFKDVQTVGVYFATYTFTHEETMLIFDNFQAFAAGDIPKGNAISLTQTSTNTKMTSGVSVNCGPYEQVITQCVPDDIKIKAKITVDSSDIGKQADILAVAIHKPYPESELEQMYMIADEAKLVTEWDGNLATLQAFQEKIVLQPEHDLSIYNGKVPISGFISVLFGYRLQDGSIIYNADNIEMFIYTESLNPKNDLPYSESIKGICP